MTPCAGWVLIVAPIRCVQSTDSTRVMSGRARTEGLQHDGVPQPPVLVHVSACASGGVAAAHTASTAATTSAVPAGFHAVTRIPAFYKRSVRKTSNQVGCLEAAWEN